MSKPEHIINTHGYVSDAGMEDLLYSAYEQSRAYIDHQEKEIATLRARIAELEQPTPTTNGGAKTLVEYLMELPDGYRERAIEQCDPLFFQAADRIYSIEDAVKWFAKWDDTNEGLLFWLSVYDYYLIGSPHPLPPLPI